MSQQPISDSSWDLVSKAAPASALPAAAVYNGYPRSAMPGAYQLAAGNNSNGSHYAVAAQSHMVQLSPEATVSGTGNGSGVVAHWHGVCLPTAPSSSSGTMAAAEQWLVAANHLHHQPQTISGINPSSTVAAPSSHAAVAAAAAAQLYSGTTTSYFATGGGEAGITHPSLLPAARPTAQGQPGPAVLSPTSPLTSPTAPLAAWPHSRNDSILAKQHHHFHLPQNHQSEQRSPQQRHHNVTLPHGLNEKTSPHYHHNQSHQQYPTIPSSTTSPTSAVAANAAASSYEKLLEAVAIQAARVPFLQQGQPAHYRIEQASGSGDMHRMVTAPPNRPPSNLLELDILRNLAASAGGATGGYAMPGQQGQQSTQLPPIGTNGYSGSSFRPIGSVTIKQEPPYCDITPPPPQPSSTGTAAMPPSDLDVAHTMLSIQACSIETTVPEYQQISPAPETSQTETKYQPPRSTGANADSATQRESGDEEDRKAFAAITVETAQNDSDDAGKEPTAKKVKMSVSDDYSQDDETVAAEGVIADGNHSNLNAQGAQAKSENDADTRDESRRKSTSPTGSGSSKGDETLQPASHSLPLNDTPLSVGGRTDRSQSGHCDSPTSAAATATATAVSVAGANIVLPTASSTAATFLPATATNPPGHIETPPHASYSNSNTCHICGYTNASKFHFNSHMNTHADHKCTRCDYTSRTEGRLKRHMTEFHSPPQVSAANSNDESSLPVAGNHGGAGSTSFDQSLEDQLQAVVCGMKAGPSSFGAGNKTSPNLKPASSSGNKLKTYRCKQCDFVAKSKDDMWSHSRAHIKPDKLLACDHCAFVTEYKHHLEYHQRNHSGMKPFKCAKCNYSCVNKSMLNSHMKSHSNEYHFRCADCTYATKYCHSLKLHLRKYEHHAASTTASNGATLVDGTAIDVYGNRRGPRGKRGSDSGNRSNAECPRTMVTAAGPLSSGMNIASPSQLLSQVPGTSGLAGCSSASMADTVNHHNAPTMVTAGPSRASPSMPSFVEALQSSLLAHQQKDLTAAMVTSIATLGAQLPTIPSIAAVLAAAQNQPTASAASTQTLSNQDSCSPQPIMAHGAMPQMNMMTTALRMTSPPVNIQSSQLIKCNLCDFSCTSKEILTKHTLIHMMEKPEQLYQVYSFMASAAVQAQAVAAAAAALVTTSQQSTSGSSSCGSTPVINESGVTRPDTGLGRLGLSTTPSGIYTGMETDEQMGESFLQAQDVSQDSGGSPGSVCGEKASGDEGMGGESLLNATSNSGVAVHRQRRKGRAFKLDRIALKLQGKGCDDDDPESVSGDYESMAENRIGARHTRSTSPVASCSPGQAAQSCRTIRSESVSSISGLNRPVIQRGTSSDLSNKQNRGLASPSAAYPSPMGRPTNIDWSNAYVCNYCEIAFKDCIMYTMHMGFHGYQDPYKCNTCGHVSDDPRSMFLHIAREPHL